MKALIVVTSAALLSGAAGSVIADCATTPLTNAQLTTLFPPAVPPGAAFALVCGKPGAGYPGAGGASSPDRWQEEHLRTGALWDYKKGSMDKVDPRKEVGKWALGGTTIGTITHTYGSSPPFVWTVHPVTGGVTQGNTFSFCSGGVEHVLAKVIANTSTGCAAGNFP